MRGSSHANTIVTFVYTNGEFARNKSEKKKTFMIGSKKNLGTILTKEIKALHNK